MVKDRIEARFLLQHLPRPTSGYFTGYRLAALNHWTPCLHWHTSPEAAVACWDSLTHVAPAGRTIKP